MAPSNGSQQSMTNGSAAILLIDDDEFIAGSLRDYLRAQGLCVDVALELPAAETLMRARQYGIVVVDPYLTGGVQRENAKLLRAIRELQPGVPIMIVTGYGSAAMIHAAAADEQTTLLFKPQPITYLSQLIVHGSTQSAAVKGNV
jgi:DNA-binding NtrC family response regulator